MKGARPVQDAVFRRLGFNASAVALTDAPITGVLDQKEFGFIQELRDAVNSHNGSSDLNAIMKRRADAAIADPSYAAYINNTPRSTFSFASEGDVRLTFNDLWLNVYRESVFNKLPELRADTAFASSKELVALASMTWNGGSGILGNGLRNAINADNRAEAWYEIRYGSNGNQLPGLAKRRFYESEIFGLYNPGVTDESNITESEAKDVMRMYTHHRPAIKAYEAKYGKGGTSGDMVALANNNYGLSGAGLVGYWDEEDSPAAIFLMNQYVRDAVEIATKPIIDGDVLVGSEGDNSGGGGGLGAEYDLTGTDKNDLILGEGGNDTIRAGKGADVIYGGAGNDELYGGAGKFDAPNAQIWREAA